MSAKIIRENDPTVFSDVVYTLANGGIVVAPTETCYGLLADATNRTAVEKIFQIKGRPHTKSISIFVFDDKMLYSQVDTMSPASRRLLKKHLPGPLTLILRQRKITSLAPNLSQDGSIAIRISSHPFIAGLLFNYEKPVTATSANLSGKGEIYSAGEAIRQLGRQVDIIIDGGTLEKKPPSTIVDFTGRAPLVVRHGPIKIKL